MPRPQKCRKICALPETVSFAPLKCPHHQCDKRASLKEENPALQASLSVEMSLDEYETIRLIDLLCYTQEECALQMEVARTTVQAVYNTARKKLADVLINGKQLEIRGGNYTLCSHSTSCCGQSRNKRPCERHGCRK